MYTVVTYSYLLLPLAFFIAKNRFKDIPPLILAIYGCIFFVLLQLYYNTPKEIREIYQSAYTFLEYSVFSFTFYYVIKEKVFRKIIIILSILFIIFQVIYISSSTLLRLDTIPIGIETILILIYIFYFFYDFSKRVDNGYIYNHYCFWISIGILLYLGGSLFFFIMIDQLGEDDLHKYGNLTFIAEVVKNILFVISMFVYARSRNINLNPKQNNLPNLDMI